MKKAVLFLSLTVISAITLSFVSKTEMDQGKLYKSKDGKFSINFFGHKPTVNSQSVETEVGDIEMYTFMYEKSATEVYMVAYADYPSDLVKGSDSYDLLKGARDGALGNLGIHKPEKNRKIKIDGYPGLYFTGNNGQYYVAYRVYLVKNRLYQVAILRDGAYPSQTNEDIFMKSFRLSGGKQ